MNILVKGASLTTPPGPPGILLRVSFELDASLNEAFHVFDPAPPQPPSCRPRVLACVLENPGAHLRDIARRCALPLGTTLYHLDRLESHGDLTVRRDGRYKRYYGAAAMGRHEKDLLSALRHDAPRKLPLALLACGPAESGASGGLTQREMTVRLGLSRSTVSFHAAQLTAHGILRRVESRPERRYEIVEPGAVSSLLERYRVSLETPSDAPLFARVAALARPADEPAAAASGGALA